MKKIWLAALLAGAAALAATARAAKPELAIHIATVKQTGTKQTETRRLALIGPEAQFAVVLTNVSSRPLRLWKTSCSWGYDALSFEMREASATHRLRRTPVSFRKNFPQFVTLAPGESLRRWVALASNDWEGFPVPAPGHSLSRTLRAVFEIKPDAESRQYQVWTGRIATPFAHYVLERGAAP